MSHVHDEYVLRLLYIQHNADAGHQLRRTAILRPPSTFCSITIPSHVLLTVLHNLQQTLLHTNLQACGSCSGSAWRAAMASPAQPSATCQVQRLFLPVRVQRQPPLHDHMHFCMATGHGGAVQHC
jgi:hypothetical protein